MDDQPIPDDQHNITIPEVEYAELKWRLRIAAEAISLADSLVQAMELHPVCVSNVDKFKQLFKRKYKVYTADSIYTDGRPSITNKYGRRVDRPPKIFDDAQHSANAFYIPPVKNPPTQT